VINHHTSDQRFKQFKPWFDVKTKIISKNFRPEPPPSVDRPIFFISGAVPS